MPERPNLFEQLRLVLETGWLSIFPTYRGHALAVEFALEFITCDAPVKTIAAVLESAGKGEQNHKPYYELFSESPWKCDDLFQPVIAQSAKTCLQKVKACQLWLPIAVDDTLMKKTSSKIPGVTTARDPLSLPFHVNLVRGLRVIQASAIIPHYKDHNLPARAYPVASRILPPVKKPGKNAVADEVAAWKQEKKQRNLNTGALEMLASLRSDYDKAGYADARLLVVADGSYCNSTIFKAPLDRADVLARCRKDARLCYPAAPGSRKKYNHEATFTPEGLRKNADHRWIRIRVFYGGKWRKVLVKVVRGIVWQRGAGLKSLTLIVIKPREFRPSSKSKTYFKDPVYLLTSAVDICLTYAVRTYFGRGGIEDNFRDQKSVVKVNEAQVWCPQSAKRYIPFATAVYSLMLITSLVQLGPTRTSDYPRHPRWRNRPQTRPSARDTVKMLQTHRRLLANSSTAQDRETVFSLKHIASRLAPPPRRRKTQPQTLSPN